MKKSIVIIFISAIAFYLSYLIFFNKSQTKQVALQTPSHDLNVKAGSSQSIIDSVATSSKGLSVDFVPAKENILNAKSSEKSSIDNINEKSETKKPLSANYGVTEGVDPQANAQVASVADALKNKNHPERLSPLIQPKPFNRDQFEKDPDAYLNTIEPGRVFQSKNPGAGIVVIQRISEPFVTIQQKDKTVLKVKALPNMPVSFTSFDLGAFQNNLTSITVRADKEGFAEATFIGTEGTLAECNILASCPETSGNVKFIITIQKNNLFGKEN